MSSLGELFASVGYKVDDESIRKYDKALEESKAKTKAMDESSQALLKRMADLKSARDQEAAQVRAFLKLQEELTGKQETDEEKQQRIAKAMGVVGFEVKKTGEELSTSEKKARDWAKTVIALESGLNLASKAFGFVRGKIQGMLGAIGEAGGKAGSVAALSSRVGLSTDALQELGYAAEQNASDMSTLANGWKSFANKADSAAKGSKDAARAFRDVGVSAKDLRSGKLGLDDALGKVADKFKQMEDGPKKAALAMDLFGGSGGALIPLLNQGSAGIAALRAEARKLGVVISEDGIKGLAGFDDQTSKLKTTVNALRTQALAAIIPTLSKVLEKFQAWLGENREKAVAALTAGFKILVDVLSKVADGITMITPLITLVAENMDTVTAALGGVVGGLIAYNAWTTIAAAGSIKAAISTAAAWVVPLAPFIAIGLAIAAVIRFWPQIKSGAQAAGRAIRDAFYAVKDAVVGAFTVAYDWVVGKIDSIRKLWQEFKNNLFKGPTEKARELVSQSAGNTGLNFLARQQAQSVPSSAQRAGSSTTIQNTITIPVTSNSADPIAVGKAVRTEMRTFWDAEMRKAGG